MSEANTDSGGTSDKSSSNDLMIFETEEDFKKLEEKTAEPSRFNVMMEYNGLVCPDEWMMDFTPLEFEESAAMFIKYDEDAGGTIDLGEMMTLLHDMELDFSEENALNLMKIVDEDGSGELDFDEFITLIGRIKRGDATLESYSKIADSITNSPIQQLHAQCQARQLIYAFRIIEERVDSRTFDKTLVYEVKVVGDWFDMVDGVLKMTPNSTKQFQGIGKNTKDAKTSAAQAALKKMKEYMPGTQYHPGFVPRKWMEWIELNLKQGAGAQKVLETMRRKGFMVYK